MCPFVPFVEGVARTVQSKARKAGTALAQRHPFHSPFRDQLAKYDESRMLCLRSRLESKFPSEQQVEQAKPVLDSPPAPPSGDRAGEAEMRCLRSTLRGKSLADVASIKGSQACGRPAEG